MTNKRASVPPRSSLYVPADQPRMLARALDRGADAIIVDLEDSVAQSSRAGAREILAEWLTGIGTGGSPASHGQIWVRLDSGEANAQELDTDVRAAVRHPVTGIVAAKCESVEDLRRLDAAVSRAEATMGMPSPALRVSALIESAQGLGRIQEIAHGPRVWRLQLGEADLIASLGIQPGPDDLELLPLRMSLVVMSAAAGLEPPIGSAYRAVSDTDGLRRSSEALRRLGFRGRTVLHPVQVPIVQDVFTPSLAEREHAAALVAQFRESARQGKGVFLDDGSMIDAAVVRSAQAVLDHHSYHSRPEDE